MPKYTVSTLHQKNSWFFYGFYVFILIGGLLLFTIEQGDSIFFFSENRSSFGDWFFAWFTKMGEEPAYILAIILLLFFGYRYIIAIPLMGIVVTMMAAALKLYFSHPRPMAYFQELGVFNQLNLIEDVILRGGPTSFPSGHTMSGFALYSFICFCIGKNKGWSLFFFAMALLVGISRIYLVQHFLKDIYLGAIIGVSIGILFYWLQSLLSPDTEHWWNGKLKWPFAKNNKSSESQV